MLHDVFEATSQITDSMNISNSCFLLIFVFCAQSTNSAKIQHSYYISICAIPIIIFNGWQWRFVEFKRNSYYRNTFTGSYLRSINAIRIFAKISTLISLPFHIFIFTACSIWLAVHVQSNGAITSVNRTYPLFCCCVCVMCGILIMYYMTYKRNIKYIYHSLCNHWQAIPRFPFSGSFVRSPLEWS